MTTIRIQRLSVAAPLIVAGLMTVLSCRLDTRQGGWSRKWGAVPVHRTFPGDCGTCHAGRDGGALRQDFTFDHARETGHRLEEAHAHAACLRCHNDQGPVTTYVARGCAGCHGDPHVSALGSDCGSCHGQVSWKPKRSAARDVQLRFHRIPAHAVPPCASCHVEAGIGRAEAGPTQCGPCHEGSSAPFAERP